jgi:hypothetical protein
VEMFCPATSWNISRLGWGGGGAGGGARARPLEPSRPAPAANWTYHSAGEEIYQLGVGSSSAKTWSQVIINSAYRDSLADFNYL